ncbi:hypothetical protein CJ030_MR0G028253 [Morella rubra]|uniref:Uncharacterized protein n=1 Tax=Morella rubra TaxID=262757 RepID=A0A6A1UEG3_9ROSI|nr:hypothetical protein CJ030_MR0G028253 [Morella rubra]
MPSAGSGLTMGSQASLGTSRGTLGFSGWKQEVVGPRGITGTSAGATSQVRFALPDITVAQERQCQTNDAEVADSSNLGNKHPTAENGVGSESPIGPLGAQLVGSFKEAAGPISCLSAPAPGPSANVITSLLPVTGLLEKMVTLEREGAVIEDSMTPFKKIT